MSDKTIELIHLMLKQHDKMRKIYKNISVIDGQYDMRLKTAAKVIAEVLLKRKTQYEVLLCDAAKISDDASDEGFNEIKKAILLLGEGLNQAHFNNLHDFTIFVIGHTEGIINIVDLALKRINYNKTLQMHQEQLEEALIKVRQIEVQFDALLKAFQRNEKQLV